MVVKRVGPGKHTKREAARWGARPGITKAPSASKKIPSSAPFLADLRTSILQRFAKYLQHCCSDFKMFLFFPNRSTLLLRVLMGVKRVGPGKHTKREAARGVARKKSQRRQVPPKNPFKCPLFGRPQNL